MDKRVHIFLSYADPDRGIAQELLTHLQPLQSKGLVTVWSTDSLIAGQAREQAILDHLYAAQIILFLVSPDFLASEEHHDETLEAMERAKLGKALVIPIISRPFDKNATPFAQLASLPRNGKPIVKWAHRELAYLQITEEIMRVITDLNLQAKVQGEEVNLQKALETFSERDLRLLRFDLGLPPDIFPRNTKEEDIPELLIYMKNQDRIQELANYIRKRRPNFR